MERNDISALIVHALLRVPLYFLYATFFGHNWMSIISFEIVWKCLSLRRKSVPIKSLCGVNPSNNSLTSNKILFELQFVFDLNICYQLFQRGFFPFILILTGTIIILIWKWDCSFAKRVIYWRLLFAAAHGLHRITQFACVFYFKSFQFDARDLDISNAYLFFLAALHSGRMRTILLSKDWN